MIAVTILQLLESSAKPKLKYQQIMHEVKEYIHQKKLPLYLQDKLIFYYEYRYQDNFFKENIISDTLSGQLKAKKITKAKLLIIEKISWQSIYFYLMFSNVSLDHLNQETLFYSSQKLLDITILHNLPRNVLGDLISNYFFLISIIIITFMLLLYYYIYYYYHYCYLLLLLYYYYFLNIKICI